MGWVTTARRWVSSNWRIVAVIVAMVALLGGALGYRHCAAQRKEVAAEAQRLRDEALKAQALADAHEGVADAIGALIPALLDAGLEAGKRADIATVKEAEKLDAGRDDSVGEILNDLNGWLR